MHRNGRAHRCRRTAGVTTMIPRCVRLVWPFRTRAASLSCQPRRGPVSITTVDLEAGQWATTKGRFQIQPHGTNPFSSGSGSPLDPPPKAVPISQSAFCSNSAISNSLTAGPAVAVSTPRALRNRALRRRSSGRSVAATSTTVSGFPQQQQRQLES